MENDPLEPQVMLLTRAWPVQHRTEAFDHWQRSKHIAEIAASGLIRSAEYYQSMELESLSASFRSGLRMAVYYANDIPEMGRWMTSKELEESLADGVGWFGDFNELDGEPFTGNVYESSGGCPRGGGAVLVARWEAATRPPHATTSPAMKNYVGTLRRMPGLDHVAIWGPVADELVPVPYYRSAGHFMCWAQFGSVEALAKAAVSDSFVVTLRYFDETTATATYAALEAYVFAFRCEAPGNSSRTAPSRR